MTNDTTVIFVHIPKAAGRTLEAVLERQYPLSARYDVYGWGDDINKAVTTLEEMSDEAKRRVKLIKGHYQFGLHQYMPQACCYITMMRDPIDRVISHYAYVRNNPDHPFRAVIEAQRMTLKDYVTSGLSTELNNGQTRLLSGMEQRDAFGQCGADLLTVAQENLARHFAVVGLVERFDQSLALMAAQFEWRWIYYTIRNVSRNRPVRAQLDADTRGAIEQLNELDLALYE
jgi:hypothetical protein